MSDAEKVHAVIRVLCAIPKGALGHWDAVVRDLDPLEHVDVLNYSVGPASDCDVLIRIGERNGIAINGRAMIKAIEAVLACK